MKIVYKIGNKKLDHESFRKSGKRNGIREILDSGSFPALQTDDEFMANRGTLADQLGEQTEDVVKAARRNGYTPNYTDVYLPSAARFPGDPEAFVGHDSARGKLKKTLESRGWGCEGSVKVKARESEPKQVKLADDLVSSQVKQLKSVDPAARRESDKYLRQHVIAKHGAQS